MYLHVGPLLESGFGPQHLLILNIMTLQELTKVEVGKYPSEPLISFQ